MNTLPKNAPVLSLTAKREILEKVLKSLDAKFYKPELLGNSWRDAVEANRSGIEEASTPSDFEEAITRLLQTLQTSHLGFFHGSARRASSRAALSATYLACDTPHGTRWVFQDVHAGGAAAAAGLLSGDVLISVDGQQIYPPDHPIFPMGAASSVVVVSKDGNERILEVNVSRPKGKKLLFVEPTLVHGELLNEHIGYLKVSMFPGMLGVDVANAISAAVDSLGSVRGLVVDLRGNTGGGAGCLRLMSLLTPNRIEVGFAANKDWAQRDLEKEKLSFPRLSEIPVSKRFLWLLALRFLPSLISRSPVVLKTEGLGSKPYHQNIVLLVNRHTASAAEMVTVFAKENNLARIVGEKTAGRLLSATSVKIGHGYRLALPTGAYYTWQGSVLEGNPISPDVFVEFDWMASRAGQDHQLAAAVDALSVPV